MNEIIEVIKNAIEDKKGQQVKILDISEISSLADYFVIAHGSNVNQVQAIADNVEEKLAASGLRPKAVEGYPGGEWILMDYQDLIIHIFHQEKRSFYDLERLWKDAKEIN